LRLRYVARLNPPVAGLSREDAGIEVSFLPLERIWDDDRFDPSETIEFSGDVQSYNPVAEGDILLPKVSPTFAHGRVVIARGLTNGRGLATSEVFVIRAQDADGARFLGYRLRATDFLREGQASWTGVAGLKRVSADFVRDTPIDEASWHVGGEIADFLDRECARVEELASALREYAVDLVGPALEQFRRLTAQTSLGRIGYRFQVQLGKMLDGKRTAGDARPYLRNANVHWDRLELDDLKEMAFTGAERIKFALTPGDLLVCEGGEPGRSAVWNSEIEDCYFQKALHRVRPYGTDSTRFLLWCLRDLADRGAFTSDGPGRYIHLPAEQLRAVRVPLPAADEQARVASAVDATAQRSSTIRIELQAMDRVLTEYRDALITEAVTGKLDVTRLSEQQMDESAHAAMEGEAPEVLSA